MIDLKLSGSIFMQNILSFIGIATVILKNLKDVDHSTRKFYVLDQVVEDKRNFALFNNFNGSHCKHFSFVIQLLGRMISVRNKSTLKEIRKFRTV